ncbi:MAG TPA: DeoR/GlpR family DNA-binding transcription regulator [Dermatophilaceae bacterium]|jgi:DeoR/GlpR family transcriptional regulator of sugar metabolism
MVGRTLQSAGRLHRSAAARHQLITDRVRMDGSVTVDELVRATGVSRMTVHRDLDALETEGVLRKVRGGATATRSSIFESDLQYRLTTAVEAKAAIGRAAARFIDVGQAVIFDESTTALAALRAVDPTEPITVITNCVPTMAYVTSRTKHRLIGLGGDYVARYQAFLGILCQQMISNVYADVLIASCSAVLGNATLHQDSQIVEVKQTMIAAAPVRLLLVDSSKIDMGAIYRLGEIRDFTHLITDAAAPASFIDGVREQGVDVVVAERAPSVAEGSSGDDRHSA